MSGEVISFRLPSGLLERVKEAAKETERTKTFIFRKALEVYLEEYMDYQIALDRLNDKDDAIISSKELRKRLGI